MSKTKDPATAFLKRFFAGDSFVRAASKVGLTVDVAEAALRDGVADLSNENRRLRTIHTALARLPPDGGGGQGAVVEVHLRRKDGVLHIVVCSSAQDEAALSKLILAELQRLWGAQGVDVEAGEGVLTGVQRFDDATDPDSAGAPAE